MILKVQNYLHFFPSKNFILTKNILLVKKIYFCAKKNTMDKLKIEKLIRKIAVTRSQKGFTYENLADELNITASAYRKIETGETHLTVERLFRISELLDVPVSELLEVENEVFNQTNSENATGYQQKIEHFYQENRDVYEKLIAAKDEQIDLLKKMLKIK